MRGTNAHNLPDNGDTPVIARLPLLAAILITVLLALVLATSISWAGYYFLLRPSARFDEIGYRDLPEVVKTALAVVAGIGGTAALTVAYRKQKVAERQRELSEADANRQDRRMLHERFQNAVELLGKKESAVVRIGGAYSLEKLADDWPEERQICIKVLCGYLRSPYDPSSGTDGEREVRQTIISIVRQHLLPGTDVTWDGNLFDFSDAILDHLDLSDICLKGSTLRLRGCLIQMATFKMKRLRVVGGEVDARDLRIMDGATLDAAGCYLSDSGRISLAGSTISSGAVTFEDAEIDGGHLELSKVRVEDGGVLNLSHLRIASVPLAQTYSGQDSPLNLDEAEISGGTVNLERIQIATGLDRSKVIWGGGREEGGAQFIASFRQLIITDGRVSFNRAKIPYGKFSFVRGNFTGGVLDLNTRS